MPEGPHTPSPIQGERRHIITGARAPLFEEAKAIAEGLDAQKLAERIEANL